MFFYEAYRISASPEYPMTDRFDQLAFPTSDSGGQIQSFDHGLLGFIWESPLLIPVCEATMGPSEPFVQVDRFLKFNSGPWFWESSRSIPSSKVSAAAAELVL